MELGNNRTTGWQGQRKGEGGDLDDDNRYLFMTTMMGAGIHCASHPSCPDKAQQLGYKAKPGYVVNHIRVHCAEAKIYKYSAHTGDVGKFYPIYIVLCIDFFFLVIHSL